VIFQRIIDKYGKILIACFLLALLIISILVIASAGHKSQLSIYSDDWDDLSKLRNDLEDAKFTISHTSSSPIYLREIDEPENSIFIIAGLEREYTSIELDAISSFLSRGGNVILADDFGYGNSVLENLKIKLDYYGFFNYENYEIGYKLLNKQVVDVEYDRDPNFLRVGTKNTYVHFELVMNAPSGFIENDEVESLTTQHLKNVEILAQSSSISWLDSNGNFSRDVGEKQGPFPLILKFSISSYFDNGESTLILISDPSILINEMWGLADNREFILSEILQILPGGGEIIFDESVHLTENAAVEITNGYYIFFIYIISHPLSIFLVEFLLLFLLIIMGIKVKPQTNYTRHRDALGYKMLYMMLKPELDITDFYWIRWVILDKIRVAYEIPYEIFYSYTPEQLKVLLDDNELSDFLFGDIKRGPESKFMKVDKEIIDKIIAWKPNKVIFRSLSKQDILISKTKGPNRFSG